MKRIAASLLLVPLSLGLHAQVNAIPSAPHLLVRGHAETRYVPDRFSITLRVQLTDPLAASARQRVEDHMTALFHALDKAGAMHGRTQAGTLQVGPDSEYRDGKSVFLGTRVSRNVVATFDTLEKLKAFLASLPAGEEVQVVGTGTGRSDIDTIQQNLRRQAMANSQVAAKQIAKAYGMHVIGVYSVSEVAPDFAYGIQAGSWGGNASFASVSPAPPAPPAPPLSSDASVPTDLRVGTEQAQQDVYAVYLIGTP